MDPSSVNDDAEFWLPPEFLTDEDFLVEKENNSGGIVEDSNKYLFPNEYFGSAFTPNVRSSEKEVNNENLLVGLTKQMFQSSLEDDFSRRFCRNNVYPVSNDDKAWDMTCSPLCADGNDCFCRNQRSNQNSHSRVSSQALWDTMNINDEPYDYYNHSLASAVKNPNNGSSGYFNQHQPLPYQKLQDIHFRQLNQQQRMKHYRQLVQQSIGLNSNKNVGPVDFSTSAWSNNQLSRRDGLGMRAVFLGNDTRKRGSTGTGVFLPRRINHSSGIGSRKKPSSESEPRRTGPVFDASWRPQRNNGRLSSQMQGGVRVEQPVNEPRLPSDWAY